MLKLKVRAVGAADGLILPKEAMKRLGVKQGDELTFVETPNGYEITTYDPEFEAQVESFRKIMDKYPNTFRELAK